MCCRRFKSFHGVNTHLFKNDRAFIHEGDVQVPLGVFKDFCSFGHAHAGYRKSACLDGARVQRVYGVCGLGRKAAGVLLDRRESVDLVVWNDSLGAEAAKSPC